MKLSGLLAVGVCGVVGLAACSQSNNLLFGRVEAKVGEHTVIVTDCYRTHVPPPERLTSPPNSVPAYRFAPCRDAEVVISADHLMVNGKSYGTLKPTDVIVVDHGKVSIKPPTDAAPRQDSH
jgi:hypothetical protein